MEELRAEIASIFMAQDLGIEPSEDRLQNNAAYIQSWKDEIKENPNALFTAIADADKIARYEATCTGEGYTQYVCEVCGYTYIGKSGSGKSFFLKSLIANEWANDTRVIILDPEAE